jgi:hypothetical protein
MSSGSNSPRYTAIGPKIEPDMTHSPIKYRNTFHTTSSDAIAKCEMEDPISSQLPVVVILQKK